VSLDDDARSELAKLEAAGRLRTPRVLDGLQGPRAMVDGRSVLNLASNDYLALAGDPRLARAAATALETGGTGAGASRLIVGNHREHVALEAALADWLRVAGVRMFNSGYAANVGTISALVGAGDTVISDELNHASIIDGCRLSRAETFVYRHGDVEHLAWGLREAKGRGSLIVSDGVFSMDGDVAPLERLVELAKDHRCRLMVDEAHATGALGPGGRGSVAAAGLSGEVDLVMGTLGKALGSYGAYVCASRELTDYLVNTARSFIFSTAPPPPAAAAGLAALELLESRPQRIDELRGNAAILRTALAAQGLAVGDSETQIVPVEVGDATRTMELSERVLERGVFAQGIRPPTVPEGTSRLRLTVMSTHRADELERAAETIGAVARELGISAAPPSAPPIAVAA